jgi:integrase
MNSINPPQTGMQLYDAEGRRLYFTEDDRRAFIAAAAKAPREVRTFCGVLHATGCRISEALALTAQQIDLSGQQLGRHRHGAVNTLAALLEAFEHDC